MLSIPPFHLVGSLSMLFRMLTQQQQPQPMAKRLFGKVQALNGNPAQLAGAVLVRLMPS